jgi:hypothetical protein
MTVEVMELDDQGRPHLTGRLETLAADTLIMAVGQDADTAFLRQVPGVDFKGDGTVIVSESMMEESRPVHRRLAARRAGRRSAEARSCRIRPAAPVVFRRRRAAAPA